MSGSKVLVSRYPVVEGDVMVMGSSVDIRVDSTNIVGVSVSNALEVSVIMVDDSGVRSEIIGNVE